MTAFTAFQWPYTVTYTYRGILYSGLLLFTVYIVVLYSGLLLFTV